MTDAPKPKRQGNYKAGPGRPPGRKNNKTLDLEAAARKAAAEIDGAFDGDAHAFLQAVYRNPNVPLEIRIMAAGRALRVEKPALSSTQGRVDVNFDIGARLDAARKRLVKMRAKTISGQFEVPGARPNLGKVIDGNAVCASRSARDLAED